MKTALCYAGCPYLSSYLMHVVSVVTQGGHAHSKRLYIFWALAKSIQPLLQFPPMSLFLPFYLIERCLTDLLSILPCLVGAVIMAILSWQC